MADRARWRWWRRCSIAGEIQPREPPPPPLPSFGKCVTRRSAITSPPSSSFLPLHPPTPSRSRAVSTGESKNYTLPGHRITNSFSSVARSFVRCHAVLERGCRSERGFGRWWGWGGKERGSRTDDSFEIRSRCVYVRVYGWMDGWTNTVASVEEGRKEGRKIDRWTSGVVFLFPHEDALNQKGIVASEVLYNEF